MLRDMEVNIHEAKTHLSRLLQRVAGGEEIVIARAGKPVARLVSVVATPTVRPLGLDEGRFRVPADFNAPLPEDLVATFEGGKPSKRAAKARARRPR
jgi:prevent-host-death family protein